jgi:hypothetical protein
MCCGFGFPVARMWSVRQERRRKIQAPRGQTVFRAREVLGTTGAITQ